MSTKRTKGVSLSRPILYGNEAVRLTVAESSTAPSGHTHRWKVFVRGINDEDISWMVKRVTFKLHSSFANANRVVESAPFEVEETGWGEFEIPIKVKFWDGSDKEVSLVHHLQLHPRGLVPDGNQSLQRMVKSPVEKLITENYEEILFLDPPEAFCKLALQNPLPSGTESHPTFNSALEKQLVKDYEIATAKAKADLQVWQAKHDKAKSDLERLRLEHGIPVASAASQDSATNRHPL